MSYTMTEQDLSKLVADKMHRLTATANKITKDWHEAEDAAQQGCIKAFRYMHNFRGDCKPYSWVTRISSSTCSMNKKAKSKMVKP